MKRTNGRPNSSSIDSREERKFAFIVGAALLMLGVLAWYRGSAGRASVLAAAGLILILAGAVAPTRLRSVRKAWMTFGKFLSKITNPVFLGIVYWGVFTTLGLLRRLCGTNTLVHKAGADGYWIRRQAGDTIKSLERQF